MPKSRKLEQWLAVLAELRLQPTSDEAPTTLRTILTSKYPVAIAQAAKLIGDAELVSLIPDLVTTFARLMDKPVETDPGCLAKKEIAEALYRLDYRDETLFLQGIRHIQLEPVWGGKEDQAAKLRGVCALGLVRMNYSEVMTELADLLADPELEARIGAVRAIAYTGNSDHAPLLRLKVKLGDDLQVLSECFVALLKLAPQPSFPLIQTYLYARQEGSSYVEDVSKAEAAAFALGESRLPEALDSLKSWWQQVRDRDLAQSGLLAIAMLRQDAAIQFLLTLLAEGTLPQAEAALNALNPYRHDHHLWPRICRTVELRGEEQLLNQIAHP